jgi:hypothetical protein
MMILPCVEQKLSALLRAVDSLFRRFAVKVLVVGLRFGAGMMNDAVPMIRRRKDTPVHNTPLSHYLPKTFLT